jgi:hypothetical protein
MRWGGPLLPSRLTTITYSFKFTTQVFLFCIKISHLLKLGVVVGVVLLADLLIGAVEVLHVVEVEVGRGDVRAAAEPPLRGDAVPSLRLKVPAYLKDTYDMIV